MSAPSLSLDEAADELGVHYQTVYRWVRSGRLPASKVAGRYLIGPDALAAVDAARQAVAAPPPPSARRLAQQCQAMQRALFTGDETVARRLVRRLVEDGASVTAVLQEVVVPPLVEIGEAWSRGEVGIATEHRASAMVERLIGDVSPNPRGRRRGTVAVAALAGDRHSLPTLMASIALREDNWHTEHLGADIPVGDLEHFVHSHDVDLLVLSATGDDPHHNALEVGRQLAEAGTPTLVGGRGQTLAHLQQAARAVRRR
jgi:excisionase family DNA binding protein